MYTIVSSLCLVVFLTIVLSIHVVFVTGDYGMSVSPVTRHDSKDSLSSDHSSNKDDQDEQWLSQVSTHSSVKHNTPHPARTTQPRHQT